VPYSQPIHATRFHRLYQRVAAGLAVGALLVGVSACGQDDDPSGSAAASTDASQARTTSTAAFSRSTGADGGAVGQDSASTSGAARQQTAADAASCTDPTALIDSSGGGHALPGGVVQYDSYPPASGRHLDVRFAPEPGLYSEPVPPVEQVTALHDGLAAVIYDPSKVDAGGIAELQVLADANANLIVAPADEEIADGAAVAITWWETRQLCTGVDADAITNATKEAAAEATAH